MRVTLAIVGIIGMSLPLGRLIATPSSMARSSFLCVTLAAVTMITAGPSAFAADPSTLSAKQFAASVRKFPKDLGFGYIGAVFFQKVLYVSCNLGLVAVAEDGSITVYQWSKTDPVIEGPWLDRATPAVWAQRDSDGSLIRFDGKSWRESALPEPPRGYTRGDMLTGFAGVSTAESFHLIGGKLAWLWKSNEGKWELERKPPLTGLASVRAFLPLADGNLYLTSEHSSLLDEQPQPGEKATLFQFHDQWESHTVEDLGIEQSVVVDEGAFARTQDGGVYAISFKGTAHLNGPGRCEALARTSTGGLLASFGSAGVFLRQGESWESVAASPFSPTEQKHIAHLAEDGGRIALVTSPEIEMTSSEKFRHTGTVGIWLSAGGAFRQLKIGE